MPTMTSLTCQITCLSPNAIMWHLLAVRGDGELEITVNVMASVNQQMISNNRTESSENDSEEGSRQDDQLASDEASIMERLGPNSVDMTEEELEAAFSQLSLAYCCDQYTLGQRLEAEEHARDRAENSLKSEVDRGLEMLQTLKGMCLDIKRSSLLQQLELCLSIIRSTIERISNTAEVLGAVHQEAKSSHAVELMVAHVQNLKRRHERNAAEMEELRKQMEKSSRERQACEQREEIEAMEKEKESQKPQLRRRISVSVISKQSHRHKFLESRASFSATNENSEERESKTNKPDQAEESLLMDRRQRLFPEDCPSQTADPDNVPEVMFSPASTQTHPIQTLGHEMDPAHITQSRILPPALPPQRVRRKAALEQSSAWLTRSESYLRNCDRHVISLQRPLLQWLYHCRWIIIVVYVTVLCSILILAILVWFLQTPVLWM